MQKLPSLIQTLLSVPESHRFGALKAFTDYTVGREFHPAPKKTIQFFLRLSRIEKAVNFFIIF